MDRTIEIAGISDELLLRLEERAQQIGVDRNSLVRRLIERAVAPADSWNTLGELLAPIHDYSEAHGLSEREVEEFFRNQIEQRRESGRSSDGGGTTV